MSSFTDPLIVEQLPDGKNWRILRGFEFYTDCEDDETKPLALRCLTRILVPDGFESDFASIPRFFWPIIGHPAGKYAQAAVLHDFLYRNAYFKRVRCDEIFREACAVLGVSKLKTWILWLGIRIGGSTAYDRWPE